MTFSYQRHEHNTLLHLLEDCEFANNLAYMIGFQNYTDFTITPFKHSIQMSHEHIAISVLLYVGFEHEEYEQLKKHRNFHLVSFCDVVPTMWEFKELNVKFIDKLALMNTIIARSENSFAIKLDQLKNLKT